MKSIIRFKQFFYQFFMYFCLFNLTYFVTCSVLFLKMGEKTNSPSLVILSIKSLLFIYCVIKFICNPYNFKYFWNSFNPSPLAMKHYLIYIFVIISSVSLLSLAPYSWSSAIPYFVLLVYTLVKKPYK